MVVVGWVVLGVIAFLFLFGAPWVMNGCSFDYGYFDELGPWLLCWVVAIILTALIGFGIGAVSGAFG